MLWPAGPIQTFRQQDSSQPSQLTFIKLAQALQSDMWLCHLLTPCSFRALAGLYKSHGKDWPCDLHPGDYLTPGPDHQPHVQTESQEAQQTPSER